MKEMVKASGIRQTARDRRLDPGGLHRMINKDLRVSTAERILDVPGYELKIVWKALKRSKKKKGL